MRTLLVLVLLAPPLFVAAPAPAAAPDRSGEILVGMIDLALPDGGLLDPLPYVSHSTTTCGLLGLLNCATTVVDGAVDWCRDLGSGVRECSLRYWISLRAYNWVNGGGSQIALSGSCDTPFDQFDSWLALGLSKTYGCQTERRLPYGCIWPNEFARAYFRSTVPGAAPAAHVYGNDRTFGPRIDC